MGPVAPSRESAGPVSSYTAEFTRNNANTGVNSQTSVVSQTDDSTSEHDTAVGHKPKVDSSEETHRLGLPSRQSRRNKHIPQYLQNYVY